MKLRFTRQATEDIAAVAGYTRHHNPIAAVRVRAGRANDPGSLRHGKPDGIDFVGNSKISSFPQNQPPTA